MKLALTYKREYGINRYYPACHDSIVIAKLGHFKSFTQSQVDYMRKEQWDVEIKADIPD